MSENQFKTPEEAEAWDFVSKLAHSYKKSIDKYEGTVILNPVQYKKFKKAFKTLENLVKSEKGKIINTELNPPELHGWMSIEIPMIDVYKDKLIEFKELFECVDVFSVEPSASDSLIVGFNVNNVWAKV